MSKRTGEHGIYEILMIRLLGDRNRPQLCVCPAAVQHGLLNPIPDSCEQSIRTSLSTEVWMRLKDEGMRLPFNTETLAGWWMCRTLRRRAKC